MTERFDGSEPLVEAPAIRAAFQALFQELYQVEQPVLPLGRVMHWHDVVRQLGLAGSGVDRSLTRLVSGYFYNTSTPVPSEDELDQALELGKAQGIRQFLVATVRNTAVVEPLRSRGFVRIPWFIESIFDLRDGVDRDLRAQLGRKRFRNIVRDARRAEAQYPAQFFERADLEADPSALETAAALHECNVRKYQHARNFFSASLLRSLVASCVGEHLVICIRRDRDSGEAVQASISLIDRARKQLYCLVHGARRERVARGYNLFVADTYHAYRFAEANGIREINLGRGEALQKVKLGANRFILLNNWILNPDPAAAKEIQTIAARSRQSLAIGETEQVLIGPYHLQ